MQSPRAGEIVQLRDGIRALIRPIEPTDRDRLHQGFRSASAESIFMRFLAPVPRLTSRQLDYLTAVDHVDHEALIAIDPETGQSFGTARYIRSPDEPDRAEVAVGVGDRWMRVGLGTALFARLADRAREAGISRLTAYVHPENTAARRMVEKVTRSYRWIPTGSGEAQLVIELDAGAARQP